MKPLSIWPGTGKATAVSSMARTEFALDLLQFVPPDDPIKIFRGSLCEIIRLAPVAFR